MKKLILSIFILIMLIPAAGCSTADPAYTNTQLLDERGNAYGIPEIDDKPRVSSMPYLYDIAEGNVPGHESFTKLGFNGDVGSTEEDIWTEGGVYVFPAAAMQMEIVSTSIEDDPDKGAGVPGTGIHSVRIYYLDADYAEHTEDITLNGTGVVTTTAVNIFRVNAIRALTAGTALMAAGDINLRNLADTPVYRDIEAGHTRGRALVYTVPINKTLYITSITISSGYSTVGKNVRWTARANWDDITMAVSTLFAPFFEIQTQDATFYREFEIPYKFPATTDIKLSAIGDSANSVCTAALRGWTE